MYKITDNNKANTYRLREKVTLQISEKIILTKNIRGQRIPIFHSFRKITEFEFDRAKVGVSANSWPCLVRRVARGFIVSGRLFLNYQTYNYIYLVAAASSLSLLNLSLTPLLHLNICSC